MKAKKIILLMAMMSLGLTACGNKKASAEDSGKNTDSTSKTQQNTNTTEPNEKKQVNVYMPSPAGLQVNFLPKSKQRNPILSAMS